MQLIWDTQIRRLVPPNVTIEFTKFPVRRVYEILAEPSTGTFYVYSDVTDIMTNFPETSREKYFQVLMSEGRVSFVGLDRTTTRPTSGTQMRQFLQCGDKASFVGLLPAGIDGNFVWSTLSRGSLPIMAG